MDVDSRYDASIYLISKAKYFPINNSKNLDYNFLKSNLPLVIKTNHGSGDFALIKNEHEINLMKLKVFFRNAQKRNLDIEKKQYQYRGIEKKILVEKMLLNDNMSIPSDFKSR